MAKNKGGRPLKFKNAKELLEKGTEYFEKCEENKEPFTMSGLALSLGVDRLTLLNYSKREKFFSTVAKLKGICEAFAEGKLFSPYSSGASFNLRNNYNSWKDEQHIHKTGNPDVEVIDFGNLKPGELTKVIMGILNKEKK